MRLLQWLFPKPAPAATVNMAEEYLFLFELDASEFPAWMKVIYCFEYTALEINEVLVHYSQIKDLPETLRNEVLRLIDLGRSRQEAKHKAARDEREQRIAEAEAMALRAMEGRKDG